MANQIILKQDVNVKAKVATVSETAKSFVIQLQDADKVIFIPKRTAFSAGFISRASFIGVELSFTPTQPTTTGNGWLGNVELVASAKFQDKLETAAAAAYTASIFASQARTDM